MWKEFADEYKINSNIIKVIQDEFHFDKITKVQNVVIPEFIKNKDVIVKSCTGSGKTLAYLIPLFHKLINFQVEEGNIKNKILSVIMLPSRELSIQVFNVFLKFVSNFENKFKFSFALLIGGKKLCKDLDKLNVEIPNIIIATPGRLFDIEEKLNLSFKDLQVLILDEADKMLELGYESKVTNLLEKFPKQRRTGLFSATVNSQIENLVKVGMRNPVFIDVKVNLNKSDNSTSQNKKNESTATENHFNSPNEEIFITSIKSDSKESYFNIIDIDSNKNLIEKKDEISKFTQEIPDQLEQLYFSFDNIKNKVPMMMDIIKKQGFKKMMIFFATCNAVDYFSIILPKLVDDPELQFFKLHSKITQKKRKHEYKNFLKVERGILLTTDLSARGIDVPNVDIILQFDPPKNEEIYIHRVGRTARVGSVGKSLIFLSKIEEVFIKYLKQKNIVLNPWTETSHKVDLISEESLQDESLLKKIKEINVSDKWIYDKAVKTFVSYIRFYCEHDLKYIFDIKTLDIGNLANSLSLFRIPRIKEILGKKVENFTQDDSVNIKDLVYLNSNTAKQMVLKEEKIKKKNEERMERREAFLSKKEEKKKNRTRKEKKDAKVRNVMKDWDDMAEDDRIYKKFKKGKISKEEYEKLLMQMK